MGALFVVNMPDCVIPINTTDSNIIGDFDDAAQVIIYAPSALTGTITIQVAEITADTTIAAAPGTLYTLQSNGSDINIAASKAVILTAAGFKSLRIHSGSSEVAARTFKVKKHIAT